MPCFAGDWMHISTRDGVDIYAKKERNTPIRWLRAEGIVNGRIEDLVAILRNVEGAKDWVPNLIERSYVENISDLEAVLYDVSDLPWPVKDRDMVLHHKLTMSEDKKSLILNFESVEHPKKSKSDKYVRAKVTDGKLIFTPKGNKTAVQLTLLVDPRGTIPIWVVNLVQVDMPYDFIMSLNRYASKTQLDPLPGIQAMIDQLDRVPANLSSSDL